MSETKIREEICRLGRSLFERGLTPGSSGNISAKLDDGGWLVTPTNASLGFLDPAKLSRLGPDGRLGQQAGVGRVGLGRDRVDGHDGHTKYGQAATNPHGSSP